MIKGKGQKYAKRIKKTVDVNALCAENIIFIKIKEYNKIIYKKQEKRIEYIQHKIIYCCCDNPTN